MNTIGRMHHSVALAFLLLCSILLSACHGNGKKEGHDNPNDSITNVQSQTPDTTISRIAIKMDSIGGVYQIPCFVNGVKMNFIFDTGASSVSISLTEALFLARNGYLDKEDIIGRNQSMIADGSVVENMEINLHSIDIAGILLTDVKATIIGSLSAPLLLGQTALRRLGKIEIIGDSLFITPKDGRIVKAIAETHTKKAYNLPTFKQIESRWYDKPLAFLGYEGKIDDYIEAALMASDNDMPEQAIGYCNNALKLKKTFKAYALKGRVYYHQYDDIRDGSGKGNDYRDKAIKSLNRYLTLNENKEDFKIGNRTFAYNDLSITLAWAYMNNDSTDQALELGEIIYQRDPKSAGAMNTISFAYTLKDNYSMAEKWAKKLLDSGFDNRTAYFRLAYLADRQKRYKEAVRYYEKIIEENPNETSVLHNLGVIYYENLNNKDYAIYLWKKAARLGLAYSQRKLKEMNIEW